MPPLNVLQIPAVSPGNSSQTTGDGNSENSSKFSSSKRRTKNVKVIQSGKKNIGTGGDPPSDHDPDSSDTDDTSSPTKKSKRSKMKKKKKKKEQKKNKSTVDNYENSSNESSSDDDDDPYGHKQTFKRIKFEPDSFPILFPDGNYDEWERDMLLTAEYQQLYDVVDLEGPDKRRILDGKPLRAYKRRLILMYTVFSKTIDKVEHGAQLLCTYFKTKNAQ